MKQKIYLSAPDVGSREEQAVLRAMQSGWVAPLGPEVDAFEQELAARVGVRHGVALSSGTAALHLGLLALGVKPGDVVITSTMTFVATANAILYAGATPYFVDSDINTGNMSPSLLRQAVSDIQALGMKIGAIVPVDLLGKTVDYTAITAIASDFDIPLLCDAAESLGASHRNKPAGSWGDASIVSFNGNKIMTTSGGGMLLTNQEDVATEARYLATQARQPFIHYEHTEMGFNYRLSNVLAALGRAQLTRLDEMISARRKIRELYKNIFSGVAGVQIFDGGEDSADNCWLTSIIVDPNLANWSPKDLMEFLNSWDVESRPLWKPMHLQPLFSGAPSQIDGTSEYLHEHGLTLPSGSGMSQYSLAFIAEKIQVFLEGKF